MPGEPQEPAPNLKTFIDFDDHVASTEMLFRAYILRQSVNFALGVPGRKHTADAEERLRANIKEIVDETESRYTRETGNHPATIEFAAEVYGTERARDEQDPLRLLVEKLAMQIMEHKPPK
jgi:hypothetical protein